MNRGNRQILINPHSSIEKVPAGALNLGEIAVQHNNVEDAALYVETVQGSESGETVAKFITDKAIERLITSAQTDLESLINALSAGTIQLSGDVVTYVNELSAGTLEQIERLDESIGLPNTGNPYFDESQSVWSAINQTYEAVIASAAAATTTVAKGSDPDTEKFLKVDTTIDQTTQSKTYTLNLSGITEAIDKAWSSAHTEIQELSAATIQLSGDVVTYVNELSAGTIELSAVTESVINNLSAGTEHEVEVLSGLIETLSAATEGVIDGLDYTGVTPDGHAIVNVTEENGVITAVQGNISANTVYIQDAGNLLTASTVEEALQEIASKVNDNAIDNADGSITVTPTTAGTDIAVAIKGGEHVIASTGDGLYTDIKLSAVNPSSEIVKEEFALVGTDGTQLGSTIKIYKDSSVVSINYINDPDDPHYQNLEYTYIDVSGNTQVAYVDMSELVLEAEFASGTTVENHVVRGVVDHTSEAFLTVGAGGFKLSGVQDAIDAAKASATTKIVEGTDAGNNMEIVPTTGADGSVTYAVNLTDVASKTALDNEISARTDADKDIQDELDEAEAAVGLDNDGKHVQTSGNYTSAATTVVGEIAALDAALKEVSDKVNAASVSEGTSTENFVSLSVSDDSQGATAITIDDSALKTKVDEIESAITAVSAASVAADEVLMGNSASTSSENSIMGIKKLIEELTEGLVEEVTADEVLLHASVETAATGEVYNISATTKLQEAVAAAETSIQSVEFADIADSGETARSYALNEAGVGTNITGSTNEKVLQLDMRYLRIDCGEY